MKYFQKSNTLYMFFPNENHYKVYLNEGTFQKDFQKQPQKHIFKQK